MAAICTALSGIAKGCDNNIGGIVTLYLADKEDVASITDDGAGSVTAITMDGAVTFTEFTFRRNTSSFTEEANIDLVNGSTYYTSTINLMLHKREAAKSNSIQLIAEGQRDLVAIVEDANGLFWVFDQMQLTAVGEGSGQAKADGSKYSLTLVGENAQLAWETTSAVVATVI